jgi:hypothetical protein
MNTPASTQPIYSIPDFCKAHSISRTQAYRELATGRLAASKVGKRTVVTAEQAAAWRGALRAYSPSAQQ